MMNFEVRLAKQQEILDRWIKQQHLFNNRKVMKLMSSLQKILPYESVLENLMDQNITVKPATVPPFNGGKWAMKAFNKIFPNSYLL